MTIKMLQLLVIGLLFVLYGESVQQECGCSFEEHNCDVTVDCSSRSIEQIDFNCVAKKKPTKLIMSRTDITNEILEDLHNKKGFVNLNYLDISYNNLEDLHGSWIQNLNLMHLDVSYNNLVSYIIFLNATILKIKTDGNPFKCKCDGLYISSITHHAATEGKLQNLQCKDSDGILKPFIVIPSCNTWIHPIEDSTEKSNWISVITFGFKLGLGFGIGFGIGFGLILIAGKGIIVLLPYNINICKQKSTEQAENPTAANEDPQAGTELPSYPTRN